MGSNSDHQNVHKKQLPTFLRPRPRSRRYLDISILAILANIDIFHIDIDKSIFVGYRLLAARLRQRDIETRVQDLQTYHSFVVILFVFNYNYFKSKGSHYCLEFVSILLFYVIIRCIYYFVITATVGNDIMLFILLDRIQFQYLKLRNPLWDHFVKIPLLPPETYTIWSNIQVSRRKYHKIYCNIKPLWPRISAILANFFTTNLVL